VGALAIEVNDTGLAGLSDPDAAAGKPSPGYALCEGAEIVVGREAWRRARLRPRHVVDSFWSALDTRPLPRPFPEQLSSADLVHAHLSELWEGWRSGVSSVLLAVPGHYSAEQLALLLGVARSAGMPVDGLVDAAVAAAAAAPRGDRMLYVDVELHRTVVTELLLRGELLRGRVECAQGSGLVALRESWARRIADAFVRQTRFDPLHTAEAEQELYLKLSAWFADLKRAPLGPIRLELRGDRVAEMSGAELGAASEGVFTAVVRLVGSLKPAGETVTLLLSSRVASLPGLPEQLSGIGGVAVVPLIEGAAARGALRCREQIRADTEALPLVSRLHPAEASGAAAAPIPPAPAPRDEVRDAPSHVLLGAVAHAITGEPLAIGSGVPAGGRGLRVGGETAGVSRVHCRVYRSGDRVLVEDRSRYGTLLNGARIEGSAPARRGDRITIGSPGIELLLIDVAGNDGTPTPD
jgi:FHA domain